MDASPHFRERQRGTWCVADRIKHYDPNLAARQSQIYGILAELEADSIRKNH
jgi:hypothetical protein